MRAAITDDVGVVDRWARHHRPVGIGAEKPDVAEPRLIGLRFELFLRDVEASVRFYRSTLQLEPPINLVRQCVRLSSGTVRIGVQHYANLPDGHHFSPTHLAGIDLRQTPRHPRTKSRRNDRAQRMSRSPTGIRHSLDDSAMTRDMARMSRGVILANRQNHIWAATLLAGGDSRGWWLTKQPLLTWSRMRCPARNRWAIPNRSRSRVRMLPEVRAGRRPSAARIDG